jgi:CHASE2 domain-containing sensor protein
MTLKTESKWWFRQIAIHAVAWAAVLVGIYLSLVYSHWLPAVAILVVVLVLEGVLTFKRYRRSARPEFKIPER